MKVLIIGGTGVISSDVCYRAIEEGYDVYILNRGKRRSRIADKAHLIVADVKKDSVEELRRKIGNLYFDVVVDFLSYDKKQLEKFISIVNCAQYIFTSTATLYETQQHGHVYREDDLKGNNGWQYCVKKYACERELISIAKTNKFRYTIVRPYVTYNETRFPYQISPVEYYTIVDRIKRGLPIPICGIDSVTTVTDSMDFAIGMVGLFNNPKAYNEDFHITTDITTSWSHIVTLLASKYEKKPIFVDIPKEYLKKSRNTVIDIDEILEDKSRIMVFDNSKIKAAVPNYYAGCSIDTAIDKIYRYFENSNSLRVNYLWAGCLDRILWNYNKTRVDRSAYNFKTTKDRISYILGRNALLCKCYLWMRSCRNLISKR